MKMDVNDNTVKLIKLTKRLRKLKKERELAYGDFIGARGGEWEPGEEEFRRRRVIVRGLDRKIDNMYDKINKVCDDNGLEFGCGDYGDDYCLDIGGLSHVLRFLFNMEEIK